MTRTLPVLTFGLFLSPLLLAGCDSLSAPKAGPTASGEVLPGTISDAMLNTDRSQAQPPLAPVAVSPAERDKKVDGAASSSEAAPDTSAAAESGPAAEASPAVPPKPKPAASPKPAAP